MDSGLSDVIISVIVLSIQQYIDKILHSIQLCFHANELFVLFIVLLSSENKLTNLGAYFLEGFFLLWRGVA